MAARSFLRKQLHVSDSPWLQNLGIDYHAAEKIMLLYEKERYGNTH